MRRWLERGRPFDFRSGVPRAGRYLPDSLTVAAAMEVIRPAPVEVGYGFNADLVQVFRHVGDRTTIMFDSHDLAAIAGGVLIHNHPPYSEYPEHDPRHDAGGFSAIDLALLTYWRLGELIVVTPLRNYYAELPVGRPYLDFDEVVSE